MSSPPLLRVDTGRYRPILELIPSTFPFIHTYAFLFRSQPWDSSPHAKKRPQEMSLSTKNKEQAVLVEQKVNENKQGFCCDLLRTELDLMWKLLISPDHTIFLPRQVTVARSRTRTFKAQAIGPTSYQAPRVRARQTVLKSPPVRCIHMVVFPMRRMEYKYLRPIHMARPVTKPRNTKHQLQGSSESIRSIRKEIIDGPQFRFHQRPQLQSTYKGRVDVSETGFECSTEP
jgi:hypothetical protein